MRKSEIFNNNELINKLKSYQETFQKTLKDISKETGLDYELLLSWEQEKSIPTKIDELITLASYLELRIDTLLISESKLKQLEERNRMENVLMKHLTDKEIVDVANILIEINYKILSLSEYLVDKPQFGLIQILKSVIEEDKLIKIKYELISEGIDFGMPSEELKEYIEEVKLSVHEFEKAV